MTRAEALRALIEKVEAGAKHIGEEAAAAFPPNQYALACRAYGEWDYRTSLDAAVAFVEAVLPGWAWVMSRDPEMSLLADASVYRWDGNGSLGSWTGSWDVPARTPARALLLAALRALAAQEGEG